MASQKLTEYERKRLENIRRNDEMIAALKIHSKATELSAAAKRQRVGTKSYNLSSDKKPKTETPVVIRRSLRTRGLPPDSEGLSDVTLYSVDSVEKSPTKIKPPVKILGPLPMRDAYSGDETKIKPSVKILGPLPMRDAYSGDESDRSLIKAIVGMAKKEAHSRSLVGGLGSFKDEDFLDVVKKEENFGAFGEVKLPMGDAYSGDESDHSLIKAIVGMAKKEAHSCSLVGGLSSVKVEDFLDDVKEESFGASGDVKKNKDGKVQDSLKLGSLTLNPENIARVVPGRITAVRFLPSSNMKMIVAGNKFGNVGFWNIGSAKDEESEVYLYRPHPAPISGILGQGHCLSKIYTSCYDGFIRLMDAEKEVFDLVYSSAETVYSLSQPANDANCLYFGEGRGGLSIWDKRTGKLSSQQVLHEDRINTIDFNSGNPFIMATSSSDRTACTWDLRNMSGKNLTALRTFNHQRAVHSAYFSPSGSSLATTSMDNTIGIRSGVNFDDTSTIFHDNQTGRWISSFRAIWGWDDSYVFIGNMKRGVDVVSPDQRKTIMTLKSPDMTAIPCRFDAHPYEVGTLAGATSGGQVYVWTSS